jgi:CRISPR-associated endonuclease/helicase Cas3
MHLDAWAQTNPLPKPDPDIAPFLHGAGAQESADVQIVWRADLPENLRDWKDVIAAALPVSTEALPIPIWAVRSWLARKPVLALPDLEGINHADAEDNSEREYLIWRGPETVPQRRQVRPGDTVVVRSIEGGCDRFGWNPLSAIPVRDIGDQCANERTRSSGGRYHLRIHPDVLFPDRADLRIELWEALEAKAKDEPAADECIAKLLTTAGAQAASDVAWREGAKPYGAGTALIATSKWIRRAEEAPPVEAISSLPSAEPNETDEDDSGLAGEKVITLAVHTAGVRDKVSKFAAASGVSARICSVIDRAAEIHDIGKQDGRFQILLDHERNPADEPLAKSKQRLPVREYMRRRDDEAQYPHNARHEFMSVALADATGASGNSGDSDLLRYLVGTHHGYGRPLPPYWAEGEHMVKDRSTGIEVRADAATSLARADHGWPDLFRRLMERYGYWGLAYLEVMLRRADCVRSREEQDNK